MAETVIELDLSDPWEPPEPPRAPLRSRPLARWVAAGAVLAVASAGLVAAGAKPRTGPVYRVEHQVFNAMVAGGMLFVGRYQQSMSDPRIEGRRLSDGKVLWTLPIDPQQHYAAVSAGALILVRHSSADRGFSSSLRAVDPATGRQLWAWPDASLVGTRDGLVVVEDMPDPGKMIEFAGEEPGEEPEPADLTVNHAGGAQERRVHVLDERTGTPVWEFTAPAGTVLDYTWDGRYQTGHVTGVDQLDPSGLVTRRDIRTGAVLARIQLDWSGTPAMFSTGSAGRAVVYPDGERGGLVFDLADGRTLFRTDTAIYDGLYQCTAALFCATIDAGIIRDATSGGIAAYDSTTGRPVWRLDDYTEVIAAAGDRLVVSTFEQNAAAAGRIGILDARTGAVVEKLTGWRLIMGAPDRILLWRAVDIRTALLGELDPATGRITVFARAGDWYGPPECSAGGDTLACVTVGELTVWRLPARR